ncbi:MAG TPA: hypothetical protein VFO55_03650 [Gemmatimonadaceae bacterium]|jgi:heme/copper-type cytochrome/quinol oxidase subunit 2|nr:hypothetical protein [Gemmatimonadaceae bacterium]
MSVRYLVFFACVAACVIGHAAILIAVARRPARAGEPGVPLPRRGLEIFWALVPAVVLALVFTATWDRVREPAPRPTEVMKVAR